MKQTTLLLLISTSACGYTTTPLYDISYGVSAKNAQVSPEQIDEAWQTASELGGINPKTERGMVEISFESAPIVYDGHDYYGLTPMPGYSRVAYFDPCIVGPNTALVHELLHQVFGFKNANQDMDLNHTAPEWKQISKLTINLKAEYCVNSNQTDLNTGVQ